MKHTKCYIKDYPRPQFVRNSWQNLNGEWDFAFDYNNEGEGARWFAELKATQKINVPFSYQTPLSGIANQKRCDNIWYYKKVKLSTITDSKWMLHLEGCDYISKVWVNGIYIGSHTGGYARASFDISKAAKIGENLICVKAEDSYSCFVPRGKQRWRDENFACWYFDTNGFWKTVWLENVSQSHITSMRQIPDVNNARIALEGEIAGFKQGLKLQVKITFDDILVAQNTYTLSASTFKTAIDLSSDADIFKIRHWNNGDPALYDVQYTLIYDNQDIDIVGSYFGMVSYSTCGSVILQNDSPYYLKMLLDQGYWTDGGLTPPTEAAIELDVKLTLEAGFNGIRKHQKIEDERFYYYCDILGVSVWCEMPSAYEFSAAGAAATAAEWTEIVRQMVNHPSIMAWVPFNESWGVPRVRTNITQQNFTKALYYITKALDSRPVISNDGWDHTISDYLTLHHYGETGKNLTNAYGDASKVVANGKTLDMTYRLAYAENCSYNGAPLILSEFAGIAFKKDKGNGWGYGDMVTNEQEFIQRYASQINSVLDNPAFSGYCVTQTTDLFQEVNGLLTMDRKWKIPVEIIKQINQGKYPRS